MVYKLINNAGKVFLATTNIIDFEIKNYVAWDCINYDLINSIYIIDQKTGKCYFVDQREHELIIGRDSMSIPDEKNWVKILKIRKKRTFLYVKKYNEFLEYLGTNYNQFKKYSLEKKVNILMNVIDRLEKSNN